MKTTEIVSKLWNICNVLRDDGVTYQDYVTELTYILFLKMAQETDTEDQIPEKYRWSELCSKEGASLKNFYEDLLEDLGKEPGVIGQIYQNSRSNIDEPKNLKKIITDIDALDWFSAKDEGLGDLYEGLLEKNANESKSGAGQYFTPRVLINVMTKLVDPKVNERCNDPACGTFGFMIAAFQHIKDQTDDLSNVTDEEYDFEKEQAFSGCELVPSTHRLALMNARLHGIAVDNKTLLRGDTLSPLGAEMKDYDVVLTNPPFGTKKGGERTTRDDLTYLTSNKQLNFLQHIYRSLKHDGKGRAAVVLPDNVLFDSGDGAKIRADLMNKCNLHTILRLPVGIFYAKGVKTNVLFFTRGTEDTGNTKEVWFYDMRTDMRTFGVKTPLVKEDFDAFVTAYLAEDRHSVQDERWSVFTREEIAQKGDSLDLGLMQHEVDNEVSLQDLIEESEQCLDDFKSIMGSLENLVKELKEIENRD